MKLDRPGRVIDEARRMASTANEARPWPARPMNLDGGQ
jgi:hypothetical protein